MRISPAPCSARSCPRRAAMWWRRYADGIGSAKGGREAAEIAVRGFLDGFCDLPETMEVRRAAAIVLNSLNGWIHSQGQRDPELMGMGCTFTALVLRGRIAHVLHVGDTRAYRFSRDRLTLLTDRPCADGRPGPVEHPDPRARRRDRGAARLHQPAAGATRPFFALQRRRARLSCRRRRSPTSCANASPPRIPRARWLPPRSTPAAPTTAPRWCSMWSAWRRLPAADIGANIAQLPLIPCRKAARPSTASCSRCCCRRAATPACSAPRTRSRAARWR